MSLFNARIIVFGPSAEISKVRREFKRSAPACLMMSAGCTSGGLTTFHIHQGPGADHFGGAQEVEDAIPRVIRWLGERKPRFNLGFLVLRDMGTRPTRARTYCGPSGLYLEG